ncbi:ABC transporter substrate-binding protein [Catenulispora pinisilvae]|uniref:ABC transporter substrate-binding protein n=1 Tax=Catenulispora pinisilvae TaxID=2705253 RepID=UPI00189283BB|nr:ABC transporter substrate-binding protein [Catenulispora pinisilvae]
MPLSSHISAPSRRGVLAAAGGGALAAVLAACGGSGSSSSSSGTGAAAKTGPAGPWSFTDDRKQTVKTSAAPTRVVAFTGTAAALVDFGVDAQIVGVFGETTLPDGKPTAQAGDLNVGKVTVLGNVWGEFNVEKYAALNPQLLVTHMYEPGALWYVPDESKDQIAKLAPSVAINVARVSLPTPIQRYADLAASLGADLNAPKVTSAKTRFQSAAETLRTAAKAAGGLKVLAASGSANTFYASNPKIAADLMYFAELGVELIVPNKLDSGDYFESLSWENADKYPADLILLDSRSTALQPQQLAAKPTWNALPAVKAGQVTPWDAVPRFSYAGAAPLLENLAKAIQNSKKVS